MGKAEENTGGLGEFKLSPNAMKHLDYWLQGSPLHSVPIERLKEIFKDPLFLSALATMGDVGRNIEAYGRARLGGGNQKGDYWEAARHAGEVARGGDAEEAEPIVKDYRETRLGPDRQPEDDFPF